MNIEKAVLENHMQFISREGSTPKRWGLEPFLDAQEEYFKYKAPTRTKDKQIKDMRDYLSINKLQLKHAGYGQLIEITVPYWKNSITWIGRDWEPAVRSVVDGTFVGDHPVPLLSKYWAPPVPRGPPGAP